MKKKILLINLLLILTTLTLLQTNVFATTNTLEEIAEKFNNSRSVNNFGELLNNEFLATADENEPNNALSITITTDEGSSTVSFEREGNILSNAHLVDKNVIVAYLLADSIAQVHGYNDGELLDNFTMFTDEMSNYTVENEGFEITENNSYYSVKMDITKKVPLIDSSEFYLKPEDFEGIKDIVDAGTTGNQNGRKLKFAYNLMVNEDENWIYIGEEDEITDGTYKSILSALEVMYGNKVVEYFKSIYPEISDGITELDGFSIENDADMDIEEHPIFTNTKVVLVKIDNEYVNDEILRTEFIGETVKRGDKSIKLDFTENKSFKLGFFDEVSSSDVAFLIKYILQSVVEDAEAELEGNIVYFNIVDGKIVLGDKDNSIFKIVIADEYLEILPTKTDVEKTAVTAKHKGIKAMEYEEGKSQEHFRYGEYDVTVDVIYGNEVKEETVAYKVLGRPEHAVNILNNDDLTFKFDIEFEKFKETGKVYIDEKLVDSSNYTSKKGSTIIAFNSDYVEKLSVGEHILKVAVDNGEVSTTFAIANDKKTENSADKGENTTDNAQAEATTTNNAEKENATENNAQIEATTANDTKTENTSANNEKTEASIANNAKIETATLNNPKTGDNIIIYISLLAISLVGTVFVGVKIKK